MFIFFGFSRPFYFSNFQTLIFFISEEYEVEAIVGRRKDKKGKVNLLFLLTYTIVISSSLYLDKRVSRRSKKIVTDLGGLAQDFECLECGVNLNFFRSNTSCRGSATRSARGRQ